MNHKITILFFLVLITGTSCKLFRGGKHETPPMPVVSKPVEVNLLREDVKKASELGSSTWMNLSGKGELQLDMNGNNMSINAGFRMKRDSALWLSISPGMGITAARVLITRDSVKLVNYIEKYYSLYSISYLQEMLGAPVTLRELQNLMLGLPLFDTATYRYDSLNFHWAAQTASWSNRLFFENNKLVASSFSDQSNARSLTARYQGLMTSREQPDLYMPKDIRVKAIKYTQSQASGLVVQESGVVFIVEELSAAAIQQFPLNIPASYERR